MHSEECRVVRSFGEFPVRSSLSFNVENISGVPEIMAVSVFD